MTTQDRWQLIKEIFHSARELSLAERPDFLRQACDDESILEEVAALLAADAVNEDFLSAPAYEFAAGMLADGKAEFSPGQEVGRYEILCSLGAGGMGQIYMARDRMLGRKIALKLVAQEFATDPRRVQRFEQEARAASALNHPNVCVIHEIGVTDNGRHFIAMEYIQGITLRDQLSRGTFTPLEALHVVVQVGAALASAHAAGIVHRDIKPENIMMRPDGYVKIVDFGLAKLTELLPEQPYSDEAPGRVRTEPRTLMGTVKYMSPEQLRETPVDERTDIWSLGVVLYEMLTGSTPFEARSRNDTIALILGTEPIELLLPDVLPPKLREVVRKALEKDRAERYQTITKLVADLNKLQRELERSAENEIVRLPGVQPPLVLSKPDADGQKTSRIESKSAILTRLKSQAISSADFLVSGIRSHKTAALFAGASGVLFLLFMPYASRVLQRLVSPNNSVQQQAKPVLLTSIKPFTNSGNSTYAAISNDGKFVAHAEEQNGRQHLVLTSTTTFGSVVVAPPQEVKYWGLSFSRDNSYLYCTREEKNGARNLYRVALPGSTSIKLKENVFGPISFSPQGDRFAFVRLNAINSEYSLVLADVDGGNEQVIARRQNGDTLSVYGVAWSPDGGMVVCPAGHWDKGFQESLVGFDVKGGGERVLGARSWSSILQVAWQDDMASLVISARDHQTAPHQLWRVAFPDGTAQRITSDLDEYRGVSLSGRSIATIKTDRSWRIWIADLDNLNHPVPIASGVGFFYGLAWTSAGKLVYSSMARDRLNLYRVDPDGSNQVQLTVDAGDNYSPAASPDGRYIVFSSNRHGPFNIWRINAEDGSDPKQLTYDDGNFYPAVSPDNQWVAYDNLVNLKVSIWKVPLEGGEPVEVGERYRMPVFSPDNQFILGRYHLESGSRDLALFPARGGRPLRQFTVPVQEWQRVQWIANGQTLSYVKNADGYSNLWSYDLTTGAEKQLTNFNTDLIYAYAWSPDYKQLACQRGSRISDVTIITSEQ